MIAAGSQCMCARTAPPCTPRADDQGNTRPQLGQTQALLLSFQATHTSSPALSLIKCGENPSKCVGCLTLRPALKLTELPMGYELRPTFLFWVLGLIRLGRSVANLANQTHRLAHVHSSPEY